MRSNAIALLVLLLSLLATGCDSDRVHSVDAPQERFSSRELHLSRAPVQLEHSVASAPRTGETVAVTLEFHSDRAARFDVLLRTQEALYLKSAPEHSLSLEPGTRVALEVLLRPMVPGAHYLTVELSGEAGDRKFGDLRMVRLEVGGDSVSEQDAPDAGAEPKPEAIWLPAD